MKLKKPSGEINNFVQWNVDERVAEKVKSTCFGHFLEFKSEDGLLIKHDKHLITAMAEFFNPDTLLRVSGKEEEKSDLVVAEHLGLTVNEAQGLLFSTTESQSGRINLALLKERFETVPVDSFLQKYNSTELKVAEELLSNWVPFLSRGLCSRCTQTLTHRIRSLQSDREKLNLGYMKIPAIVTASSSPYCYCYKID
ncbi:hypothetical protein LIER_42201 [Lithospermum erythrorhizon]|uniref:Uncharacterized protein n=1 Tax=Lithospermum erythrorhizon TaxID=34254 RepID=A0AAV3RMR9_LITER